MNYISLEARRLSDAAAVAEYAYRLEQGGWDAKLEEPVGNGLRADLIARRSEETMLVEFKRHTVVAGWKTRLRALRDAARGMGASFKLVFLPANEMVSAEISDLDQLLLAALLEDVPSKLLELSAHTQIKDVTDGAVDRVTVTSSNIEVEGTASVTVTLHGEEGNAIDTISAPFKFAGLIDAGRSLSLTLVRPDLSIWYGEAA